MRVPIRLLRQTLKARADMERWRAPTSTRRSRSTTTIPITAAVASERAMSISNPRRAERRRIPICQYRRRRRVARCSCRRLQAFCHHRRQRTRCQPRRWVTILFRLFQVIIIKKLLKCLVCVCRTELSPHTRGAKTNDEHARVVVEIIDDLDVGMLGCDIGASHRHGLAVSHQCRFNQQRQRPTVQHNDVVESRFTVKCKNNCDDFG